MADSDVIYSSSDDEIINETVEKSSTTNESIEETNNNLTIEDSVEKSGYDTKDSTPATTTTTTARYNEETESHSAASHGMNATDGSEKSDDDDSMVMKKTVRRQRKRIISSGSDTADDDDDDERRASLPSEKSDDDNNSSGRKPVIRKSQTAIPSDTDTEDDEHEVFHPLSPRTRMSISGIRPKDLSDSDSTDSDREETNDSLEGSNESLQEKNVPLEKSPTLVHRYSEVFESKIKEKLSSTICNTAVKEESEDDSNEVEIISEKNSVCILSSDDEEGSKSSTDASVKYVQPTLGAIKKVGTQPQSELQYVSQEYYNKQVKELQSLKDELKGAEVLLNTMVNKLPDGGRQLELRVSSLKADIEKKSQKMSLLRIESTEIPATKKGDPLDWEQLSKAVNEMQPQHTGRQGMATFANQKALTVDRLKDLHGSLENCPNESVLAEDPPGLKVSLMNHQKHALAWMIWREKQNPRGGILADDMGLGKTLSTVSLILASKQHKHNESDSEDESSNGWSTKGKRDYFKGGTLVVCPASLIEQWKNEIDNKLHYGKLTAHVHHGSSREKRAKHIRTYDVVITPYQTLSSEVKNNGPLTSIKWERIVLDEAHCIRNHKTKISEAVCSLRSTYRWILTGTPIQNKEMDIYALLKFLRCSPFDELPLFKKWVANKSAGGQQRLTTIMKTIMLRRTKLQLQDRGELSSLPPKSTDLIYVELNKDEMNVYQKIMAYSRTLFAQFLMARAERNSDLMYTVDANRPTYMQTKDPNGAYYKLHQQFTRLHHGEKEVKAHEILLLILRLRQICVHPGLIDAMLEDEVADESLRDENDSTEDVDLLQQLNKLALTDGDEAASTENVVAKGSAKVLQRSNPVFDLGKPSSKMLKMLDVLKSKALKNNDKAIIVSQWTSVLNIIESQLKRENIAVLSITGSIAVKDRQGIIDQFNKPSSSERVLLLSLTAGGVGLNLVGANHIFMVDLHWNPQLEAQAQDRIYRFGQTKNVFIHKFVCKDTIEERIKSLQDTKLSLAEGVLTGVRSVAGSKLSIDEMKKLFDM